MLLFVCSSCWRCVVFCYFFRFVSFRFFFIHSFPLRSRLLLFLKYIIMYLIAHLISLCTTHLIKSWPILYAFTTPHIKYHDNEINSNDNILLILQIYILFLCILFPSSSSSSSLVNTFTSTFRYYGWLFRLRLLLLLPTRR